MRTLHLVLKKKWYDMIASGEKREEYREIKPYWVKRLVDGGITDGRFKDIVPGTTKTMFDVWRKKFDFIEFRNGYAKSAPTMVVKWNDISIGKPISGLSEEGWLDKDVFIIKLGDIYTP